jgi:hypothetical protein
MKRQPHHNDDSWEHDAVWNLLDQAPPASAGQRFAEDTVRAARLAGQAESWWKGLLSPAPLAGLAAACAALAFAVISLTGPAASPDRLAATAFDSEQAAAIQEIAETEMLSAAVDHLDDFSDTELVSLIGF